MDQPIVEADSIQGRQSYHEDSQLLKLSVDVLTQAHDLSVVSVAFGLALRRIDVFTRKNFKHVHVQL
jgi:hypothetical protein